MSVKSLGTLDTVALVLNLSDYTTSNVVCIEVDLIMAWLHLQGFNFA